MVEPVMLGLTSYQESLRALGRQLEPATRVRIVELPEQARVQLTTPRGSRLLGVAELEEVLLASHARRGERRAAGPLSDVLRSVGLALDELHALDVCLNLSGEELSVRFSDQHRKPHELKYAGEELEALRLAAAARRNGSPLRRVLILNDSADSAAPLYELLVAEFAVQALPTMYARAVAEGAEPPDLVLAQASNGDRSSNRDRPSPTVEAIHTLRSGGRTAGVPIVVLAAVESHVDPAEAFAAGADDLLQEPVQPAQLRARLRTWLLRRG